MGLRINTNVPSLSVQRNVENNTNQVNKSYAKLSSGNRISRAGDDAAGLSISQNLEAQTRGLKQAQRNANDGISFVQTAEGGLNEVSNILIRLRELGVQAASDTVGQTERGFIDKEFQSLKSEIDRISQVTNFNGTNLLNGSGETLSFHVGANAGPNNRIDFSPQSSDARTATLGVEGISAMNRDGAADSLAKIDAAITRINENRSTLGAIQNRLGSTAVTLGISAENLSEAKSRIADTDIASETSNLVKNSILQNAGVGVLSQANTAPNLALKLL